MSDPMISTASTDRTRQLLNALTHRVRQTARRWHPLRLSNGRTAQRNNTNKPAIYMRSSVQQPTALTPAGEWVEPEVDEIRCRFHQRTVGIWVRRGSADAALAKEVLSNRSPWHLPALVQPRVIFDIGAGVGVWALYLSILYPEADLYCFEPDRSKAAVLRRNASRYSQRIRVIGRGMSNRVGQVVRRPADSTQASSVAESVLPVTSIQEAMRILGLEQVDLFHLHAPGSEMAILSGMEDQVRRASQAWVGQLHGIEDWRFCELLSVSHELSIQKTLGASSFPIQAVRRDLL